MSQTRTLFLENTYLFAILCRVQEVGTDENGNYILLDQSIFYPGGGGQKQDAGYISYDRKEIKIVAAKYTDTGVRHYLETSVPEDLVNTEIAMHIFQDNRKQNAAYHSAGHWLSQVVLENMRLPLFPIKGHHYAGEAYLEFEGNINCITADTIDQMRMVMAIDLQSSPKIIVQLAEVGSKLFQSALLPKNFKPPVNKPLRFTQIEGYKWLPCGGTHVEALREIKSVLPTEFYVKNGKLRLKYSCEMWEAVAV